MLKDLNPDELKPAELMSQISEDSLSAGWMNGLEFELWDIINGSSTKHGYTTTQSNIDQLESLSQKCGAG